MSQTKKPREWTVLADDYPTIEEFRRAVTEELVGLENIGYRTGGAFTSTPLRVLRETDHGFVGLPEAEYEVVGWLFRQEFAPAGRATETAPVEEPSAEEEPAAS